jgi:hypothetical protein
VSATPVQERPPFAGHSPDQHRPLGGYATLTSVYLSLCAAFVAWLRIADRELPDRIGPADLALVAVATHKASRLLAKDRVTSAVRAPFTTFQGDGGPGEVEEAARGRGLRRAVGELLVCPYCLGLWIASALLGGLIALPRPTRWIASLLVAVTGADLLQIAHKRAEPRP